MVSPNDVILLSVAAICAIKQARSNLTLPALQLKYGNESNDCLTMTKAMVSYGVVWKMPARKERAA